MPKVTQWPSSLQCLEANDFRRARHNLCPKSATRSQGVLAPPPCSFSPVFRSLIPPLSLPLVTIQTRASDASLEVSLPGRKTMPGICLKLQWREQTANRKRQTKHSKIPMTTDKGGLVHRSSLHLLRRVFQNKRILGENY